MKRDNIFWGVCFLLGAILLIMSRLWGPYDIGLVKIMITIICIAIIVRGIPSLNFWEILLPVAMLCTLYDDELNLTELTPWPIFAAAVLASIGLDMLFGYKRNMRQDYWQQKKNKTINVEGGAAENGGYNGSNSYTGEKIYLANHFASSTKYINSDNFRNAFLESSFGEMSVYFDNAMIQGQADITVSVSFGQITLYVPRTWYVDNQVKVFLGSVTEKGRCQSTGAPVLRISGNASFGELLIHYI